MSLRKEDCKNGVEVICINSEALFYDDPVLSIGAIYTIKDFTESIRLGFFFKLKIPCIALEEAGGVYCDSCKKDHDSYYPIGNFKLRDKEELVDLFRIKDIDLPLNKEDITPKIPIKEDA